MDLEEVSSDNLFEVTNEIQNKEIQRWRHCAPWSSHAAQAGEVSPLDFCSVLTRTFPMPADSSAWIPAAFSRSFPPLPAASISVLRPEAPTFFAFPLRTLQILRLLFCPQFSLGLMWVASQSVLCLFCRWVMSLEGRGDENPLDRSPLWLTVGFHSRPCYPSDLKGQTTAWIQDERDS